MNVFFNDLAECSFYTADNATLPHGICPSVPRRCKPDEYRSANALAPQGSPPPILDLITPLTQSLGRARGTTVHSAWSLRLTRRRSHKAQVFIFFRPDRRTLCINDATVQVGLTWQTVFIPPMSMPISHVLVPTVVTGWPDFRVCFALLSYIRTHGTMMQNESV
jgi:hypothetical protein